jgi:hypothetical protein
VPNRIAVLADQRWLQVLGCTAALLAALACASFFVNTARADDLAPSTSIEAAPSSALAATDSPPAAAPPVTAAAPGAAGAATDAGSTSGTATDANASTADAADASGTTTSAAIPAPDTDTPANAADASDTDSADTYATPIGATDPSTDVPAPSDTTSTSTDATATTVAPGPGPEAPECPPAPSDTTSTSTDATATTVAPGPGPEAPECTPAPSDTTSTSTDATATTVAPGTAPEAAGGTGAVDTGATSGAVPEAASGFSAAHACASNKRVGRRCGSDAVNGSTDSVPPPSEPAPAGDGSSASGNSETLSGLVHGASAGSTATSAAPEVADDPTTTDSLLSGSFLDLSTEDSGLGSRTVSPSALMVNVGVGSFFRSQVDHRVVACKSAVSASVRSSSDRILVARLPAHLDTNQAARSGVTGEKKHHSNETRKLGSPVPPAPDNDKPLLPPAPSSSLGSGGSGGIQGKGVYGVVTARLSLVPPRVGRPVTLVEKRRRALRLFFILERPG